MKIKLKLKQGVRGQVKGGHLKSQSRKGVCRCQVSESGSDPNIPRGFMLGSDPDEWWREEVQEAV